MTNPIHSDHFCQIRRDLEGTRPTVLHIGSCLEQRQSVRSCMLVVHRALNESFFVCARVGDIVSASCDAGGCPGGDTCVYDYGSGDYACCECGIVQLIHDP